MLTAWFGHQTIVMEDSYYHQGRLQGRGTGLPCTCTPNLPRVYHCLKIKSFKNMQSIHIRGCSMRFICTKSKSVQSWMQNKVQNKCFCWRKEERDGKGRCTIIPSRSKIDEKPDLGNKVVLSFQYTITQWVHCKVVEQIKEIYMAFSKGLKK